MASIMIRNLDGALKSRLRVQVAVRGRSMEEEARDIIRAALNREPKQQGNLATSISDSIGEEIPPLQGISINGHNGTGMTIGSLYASII